MPVLAPSRPSVLVSAPARLSMSVSAPTIIFVPLLVPAVVDSLPVAIPPCADSSEAILSALGYPQDEATVTVDFGNRAIRLVLSRLLKQVRTSSLSILARRGNLLFWHSWGPFQY